MKKPHIKDYFTKQFILFVVCSTFAAGVNFGSRILFSMAVRYEVAIVFAFCCGLLTAFTLDKFFVFDAKQGKTGKQFIIFFFVNAIGLVLTLSFSLLFRNIIFPAVHFTFYPDEVAHFIGIAVPMFTNFIGHKYFSFRK